MQNPNLLITQLFQDNNLSILATTGWKQGIVFYLVGGSVRDFLIDRKSRLDDLDFEVHLPDNYAWNDFITLITQLFPAAKIEQLPYSILRLILGSRKYEFALPRTEKFAPQECYAHRDFSCVTYKSLDIETAFRRRDFTCNAVALHIVSQHEGEWVDPFNGIYAIQNKILVNCSEQFFYDPVRFVRAIRFSIVLNFNIAEELETQFSTICLKKLSNFYFLKEMDKSLAPVKFIKLFFALVEKHHLILPKSFDFFKCCQDITIDVKNSQELFWAALFIEPLEKDAYEEFFSYAPELHIKRKTLLKAIGLKQNSKIILDKHLGVDDQGQDLEQLMLKAGIKVRV